MAARSVYGIAEVCGGKVFNCENDINITQIVINDKECVTNCCYVAIKGEKHNGSVFINNSVKNGAVAVLADEMQSIELPFILVDNVIEALGKIARYYRDKELETVVAVTGSVGKTTVKEMCAAVLSEKTEVRKTIGNKNNLIGLPLSILSDSKGEIGVFEAGISEIGEMDRLSRILAPDIAVITNAGGMHGQTLGNKENIAREKLKILTYAKENCTLIVPADEPLLLGKAKNTVTVGFEKPLADYNAVNIRFNENGSVFDIETKSGEVIKDIFVAMLGRHACLDATFAFAVAVRCGLNENEIRNGLKRYKSDGIRQNIIEKNGVTVMVDCYNFGPASAVASLEAFSLMNSFRKPKRSIVMLGSMLELGESAESEHIKVGKLVAKSGVDCLITVGSLAQNIALGALMGGMKRENVYFFNEAQRKEAKAVLDNLCERNCTLLIKGSRKMKMEEFLGD